jgi:anthranilate synthase component 1
VEGGETVGRYSLLGANPLWVLENRGEKTVQTHRDQTTKIYTGDPFQVLNDCLAPYQPVKLPQLPPGIGGLFGFWGYELIKWIEPTVPIHPVSDQSLPDGIWMQVDHLMVFDQVKRKIWAVAFADVQGAKGDLQLAYDRAVIQVKDMVNKLQQPLPNHLLEWTPPKNSHPITSLPAEYTSNTTKEKFIANVQKAKEYILAGDIFQVVISQRLSTEYTGESFDLYRSLRLINPSPYMAYFNFQNWQIIGSSPEVMVKAERTPEGQTKAVLRPIAGTRRRGQNPTEDKDLALDLLADPKERAEHVMLVDLGRNDLGRVCRSGTVTVDQLMIIERYSHVMHIVSNVIGELAEDKTAWDLLKACFPAGTVSGAPKIRALEIIHELEGCRRQPYSGVYGYYDFEGQLNTAITLRTMVVQEIATKQHLVSVQAGAGLVADSDPEMEYLETLNKARGLLEAIRCLQ